MNKLPKFRSAKLHLPCSPESKSYNKDWAYIIQRDLARPLKGIGYELNSTISSICPISEQITHVFHFTCDPHEIPPRHEVNSIVKEFEDDQQPVPVALYQDNYLWVILPGLP